MMDTLRQRLEARPDAELLAILRKRDADEWVPAVFPMVEEILRARGVDLAAVGGATAEEESPPPDDEPFVPIASFATVVEADACRSALVGAGFDVMGADEYLLRVDPALGPALGGFHLSVPAGEVEDARHFLAAAEGGELSAGLIECAACGSGDVASERKTSRSGTLFNTAMVGPRIEDATISFRCARCGATWE